MKSITITVNVPPDLEERILAIGAAQWGFVEAKADEQHVDDFKCTINLTRQHFGLADDLELHGVYIDGSNIVIAHTGVSPNSPAHARILTGLWNALHASLAK